MARYQIILAYDGTRYHGFQRQKQVDTTAKSILQYYNYYFSNITPQEYLKQINKVVSVASQYISDMNSSLLASLLGTLLSTFCIRTR